MYSYMYVPALKMFKANLNLLFVKLSSSSSFSTQVYLYFIQLQS